MTKVRARVHETDIHRVSAVVPRVHIGLAFPGVHFGEDRAVARKKADTENAEEQTDAVPGVVPSADIDQVRDLLFGQEARAQRAEMETIRKSLAQQIERLDAKLTDRLDKLSDQLAAEVRTLEASLADETKARGEADDAIRAELAQTDAALADLDRRTQAEHEAIRQALAAEASGLREALEAAMSALSQRLADATADLDDRKADRTAVAADHGGRSRRRQRRLTANVRGRGEHRTRRHA